MTKPNPRSVQVIALTGSFGSGCSYIAREIMTKRGYCCLSLSDALKEAFKAETGRDPSQVPRRELQDFGDRIRRAKGSGFFAEEAVKRIRGATDKTNGRKWLVDSIRNPVEVKALREGFPGLFLFGIYADKETRWERVREKYNDDRRRFDLDDRNDTGRDSDRCGQRVGDCFYGADVVLRNDDHVEVVGNEAFQGLDSKVGGYVDLVESPLGRQQPIRPEEALMAMAYAASEQSSCLKRKVGAIITDPLGNAISSGFNEVPPQERPCSSDYAGCYREHVWKKFLSALQKKHLVTVDDANQFEEVFRATFRMLDICRAIHAEENALLNLVRSGSSVPLENCTLYTTTFPCRMCANRIAKLRVGRVVYLEPYPDDMPKRILDKGGVLHKFFEGVAFRSYFRIYGEERI